MSLCGLHEWIQENFPNIIQKVSLDIIPAHSFDYVLIDMQNVILNSSRVSANNEFTNLFLTNADVIDYCLHYVETIFTLFRPKRRLYIAIPGVEPLASAVRTRKNAYVNAQRLQQLKKKLYSARLDTNLPHEVFDTNCLLPGSQFMLELQKNVEYWLADKLNCDADWQNLEVILSAHDVPGESKQKIASYLRQEVKIIDNSSTFAVFSEDAEMVLLTSCLSLVDINILFTDRNNSEIHPERKAYQTLSIDSFKGCLAGYFQKDFEPGKCNVALDIGRLCADFALLCHISGSYYFPQLPLLFSRNCLDPVLDCYKSFVQYMKDYIMTFDKKVNFTELSEFFDKFSLLEGKVFEKTIFPKMLKYRSELISQKGYGFNDAQLRARKDIYGFVFDTRPFPEDSDVASEFSCYRMGFYKYKLKFEEDNDVRKSCMGLLKTFCWVMDATLNNNVPSWEWAYPFDYSPLISDILGVASCSFRFAPDAPMPNFAYLMFVLPPESQQLLPEILRPEISKEEKVEIDCVHFEDQKKFTILIPHRDFKIVKNVLENKISEVSEIEKLRNHQGSRRVLKSEEFEQPVFKSELNRIAFPDIKPCFVSCNTRPSEMGAHVEIDSQHISQTLKNAAAPIIDQPMPVKSQGNVDQLLHGQVRPNLTQPERTVPPLPPQQMFPPRIPPEFQQRAPPPQRLSNEALLPIHGMNRNMAHGFRDGFGNR